MTESLEKQELATGAVIERAFGEVNRSRLIGQFLSSSSDEPWQAVYKLLLWVDQTTGLARCYESDKCQPGKPWHARSLRFHDWLAMAFNATPSDLGEKLDWLFRHVSDDYARYTVKKYQTLLAKAVRQRAPFEGRNFPVPGDNPTIVTIIKEVLGTHLVSEPSREQWRQITTRIRDFIALENKRKNIVGEGFEDVLAAVVRRADTGGTLQVQARKPLSTVPGFANRREGEKPPKVDLAILRPVDNKCTLVTAKWSTRADREEQFKADFTKYVAAQSQSGMFDYVLITNEFDPARLKRACEMNAANNFMLTKVVHINPDALRTVYGDAPESTMAEVLRYIESGRIMGLDSWIKSLLPSS